MSNDEGHHGSDIPVGRLLVVHVFINASNQRVPLIDHRFYGVSCPLFHSHSYGSEIALNLSPIPIVLICGQPRRWQE